MEKSPHTKNLKLRNLIADYSAQVLVRGKQNGSALLPFVIVLPFLILIASYSMNLAVGSYKLARIDQTRTHAQFEADAGIDYALQQINQNDFWTGTGSEVELFNDGQVKVTYQVTVEAPDADSKIVTSVGRTYRPANASTPESTVAIKADLRAVTSGGTYSLITGVGGLYMQNSAKILGGDVLVNGEIHMQNSAQIGLSTNPLSVEVAHHNCPDPPDATYPRLCASGENGEPIDITNSAHIYGDVRANNQTNGDDMSNPGLTASSGVAAGELPEHDRDAQKAAVATTISGSTASCSGSQSKTWAANTKVEGDVTLNNSCQVAVEGDVWITGKLTAQNSTKIIVSDSLGTTRPNIMVDDSGGIVLQNSAEVKANVNNTGVQFLTYWSRASCSPDCSTVTGNDLYDSRNDRTINLQNSASAPSSIIYARWTQAELGNSGSVGAVIGQTVRLSNSATITFGTSQLGFVPTYWVIDGYRRVFN